MRIPPEQREENKNREVLRNAPADTRVVAVTLRNAKGAIVEELRAYPPPQMQRGKTMLNHVALASRRARNHAPKAKHIMPSNTWTRKEVFPVDMIA